MRIWISKKKPGIAKLNLLYVMLRLLHVLPKKHFKLLYTVLKLIDSSGVSKNVYLNKKNWLTQFFARQAGTEFQKSMYRFAFAVLHFQNKIKN
jgi:hypothetical protein